MVSDERLKELAEVVHTKAYFSREQSDDMELVIAELLQRREQDRWIPVAERLPEPGEYEVRVNHCTHFSHIETARYKMPSQYGGDYIPERDWVLAGDPFCGMIDLFVTHWRPLPAPPKE